MFGNRSGREYSDEKEKRKRKEEGRG